VTLTAAEVAEIMRLVEQSTFDELTLEIDGMKLTLRRGNGVATDSSSVGTPGETAGRLHEAREPASRASSARGAGADKGRAEEGRAEGASLEAGATASKESAAVAPGAPRDPNLADIPAPLLGTFYRAPKPGAPPFVEVGSTVEEDTVVAIIEVMKLMNTVRAGVAGTISEILAQDGALVEYGEPILRVRKAG
jgi:acetyl-CoA carboxylase biotin carboxyl carrier protein